MKLFFWRKPPTRRSNQTANCVRCFKPAKIWTGHVLRGKTKVIAGWCHKCRNSTALAGFSGHYSKDMDWRKE